MVNPTYFIMSRLYGLQAVYEYGSGLLKVQRSAVPGNIQFYQ